MAFKSSLARMATVGVIAIVVFASAVHAHHSNSAYDTGKTLVWNVAVTEFRFVNPHAYVFFTMADAGGKSVNGRCELAARTALARLGWTVETIKPGEKITIKGAPCRNEANVCLLNSFIHADGTEVGAHQSFSQ